MRKIKVPNLNGGSSMATTHAYYYGEDFTFEMWVKPNDASTPLDNTAFFMRGNATTANGLMIFGGKVNYRTNQSTGIGTELEEYNVSTFPPNRWTHIAVVVKNGTQLEYYRNFNLITTVTLPTWNSSTANTITIGDWNNGFGSQFKGAVALPRLWYSARTESELRQYAKRHLLVDTAINHELAVDFQIRLSNVDNMHNKSVVTYEDFEIQDDGKAYFEKDEKYYSIEGRDTLIILPNNEIATLQTYGLPLDVDISLSQKFNKIKYVTSNSGHLSELTQTVDDFYIYEYIGDTPVLKYRTEIPEKDIMVSYITKESFDYYDLFGSDVEMVYFENSLDANLKNRIKYSTDKSPLDELSGDIEFLLWTDEEVDSYVDNIMVTEAVPKSLFLTTVQNKRLYGHLKEIIIKDLSKDYKESAKFVISDENKQQWYYWNSTLKTFSLITGFSIDLVWKYGMTYDTISNMTDSDWAKWKKDYLNLGILLYDNDRQTMIANIDKITYREYIPRHTTKISETILQIKNTTPKADIEMNGSTITGVLSDDDKGLIKYRILVNNKPYYPSDGNFTPYVQSGHEINKTIDSKFVNIDDYNQAKVEFVDRFGTVQYWSSTFIGTYTGLMFKNVYNQYYTTDLGELLQYLDFGVIIAGQTTLDHEIKIKNQYGYDVENISLWTEHMGDIPSGMEIQYSYTNAPFVPLERLEWSRINNNEEKTFFVRIKTTLEVTPNANGLFHTVVKADRVGGFDNDLEEIIEVIPVEDKSEFDALLIVAPPTTTARDSDVRASITSIPMPINTENQIELEIEVNERAKA